MSDVLTGKVSPRFLKRKADHSKVVVRRQSSKIVCGTSLYQMRCLGPLCCAIIRKGEKVYRLVPQDGSKLPKMGCCSKRCAEEYRKRGRNS